MPFALIHYRLQISSIILLLSLVALATTPGSGLFAAEVPWVVYDGSSGPGEGKHVVLVSGDEEYRSEEALPQLGKILAKRHGFRCTVLFAVDPEDGTIDPDNRRNIPGLEALGTADLMIIATRFRDLPDAQMKFVAEYIAAGHPVIGIRQAVVAFATSSPTYERFGFRSKTWPGGFGRQILGQSWISHHGRHGRESTRGVIAAGAASHPILRGVTDVWGPTDVYTIRPDLADDCEVLMLGQVLAGMQPSDPPVEGSKNDPMMPPAWTRTYQGKDGQVGRVFTTTIGAATDFECAGLRRLLVNAVYWCLNLENKIPASATVDPVGQYQPRPFGFGGFRPDMNPAARVLEDSRLGKVPFSG
jgi:type 1 glutamine amidotransferase